MKRTVEIESTEMDMYLILNFKQDGQIAQQHTVNIDNEESDDILKLVWMWNDLGDLPERQKD